jgi:hypothetical protein
MGTWTTPADACEENEDRAVHVTDPYRYVFRTAERETATVPVRIELSIIEVMLIVAVYIMVVIEAFPLYRLGSSILHIFAFGAIFWKQLEAFS